MVDATLTEHLGQKEDAEMEEDDDLEEEEDDLLSFSFLEDLDLELFLLLLDFSDFSDLDVFVVLDGMVNISSLALVWVFSFSLSSKASSSNSLYMTL